MDITAVIFQMMATSVVKLFGSGLVHHNSMPKCDSCGNEHSGWGNYCPVCKARMEAAEAEKKYWEKKNSEETTERLRREKEEFEEVKKRIQRENRAIIDASKKRMRGEPVNVNARICSMCGHTNGVHVKRCIECGSDSFYDVEL